MVIPLSTVMVYSVLSGVLFVRLWVPGLGIRDGFHHWKNRSWITYHFGWAGKGGLFLEIYDMIQFVTAYTRNEMLHYGD